MSILNKILAALGLKQQQETPPPPLMGDNNQSKSEKKEPIQNKPVVFKSSTSLNENSEDYLNAFNQCTVNNKDKATVKMIAQSIIKNKARYESVSDSIGMPWFVIGLIAYRESTQDFTTHLHNGDSLARRTINEPKGRPLAAPKNGQAYTWEESAIDALKIKNFDKVKTWDIPMILYSLELYNGFGYRTGMGRFTTPARTSPYLWSMSDLYKKGKYTSDGSFNPWKIDQQAGCVPVLKALIELEPSVKSFFTV